MGRGRERERRVRAKALSDPKQEFEHVAVCLVLRSIAERWTDKKFNL
jgi:hypothetical protein